MRLSEGKPILRLMDKEALAVGLLYFLLRVSCNVGV